MEGFVQVFVQMKAFLVSMTDLADHAGRVLQPSLRKIFMVMAGGSLGALSRYGIGLLSAKLWGTHFPWGTLVVNLAGCFLIGLIFALADRVRLLTPDVRLLLITGYLGALTTFSSFSLETVNAGRSGMQMLPLANVLINNVGGFFLTFFGLWLGRLK